MTLPIDVGHRGRSRANRDLPHAAEQQPSSGHEADGGADRE